MDSTKNQASRKRLGIIYGAMIVVAAAAVARIAMLQISYEPDKVYGIRDQKEILEPTRGDILAYDGRPLAVSSPRYDVRMDCSVIADSVFRADIGALSEELSALFRDKSAAQYKKYITDARNKGARYLRIGNRDVSHEEMLRVKGMPIFRKGQYRGGIIIEKHDSRIYPYGKLARRVIGYVKDNDNSSGNNLIGLEGKFNYALHGQEGERYLRRTENSEWIPALDREIVEPVDGADLYTTLDVNIQDIADRALRSKIDTVKDVEGGCVIVMDVQTGAVRAMVNLHRGKNGKLDETLNYAIRQTAEPGSVFKLASLMTLLEDNKTTLSSVMKTNRGRWSYNGTSFYDDYIARMDEVSVLWGFKKSSNQVFRKLVCDNYTGNEKKYIDKLYSYKLCEKFNFDIDGEGRATIPVPGSESWSGTSLPSIAIGYNVMLTPLHIVTFYNGVANNGKLMKPYLVESLKRNGVTVAEYGPVILNGALCRQKTIDSLHKALRIVVTEGTGSALRNARCHVSGKTGTARIPITYKDARGKEVTKYQDPQGYKRHQATFVGFFPSEKPKYTAIVVIYSKKTRGNFYGGSWSAPVFRQIVDEVYTSSCDWDTPLEAKAKLPEIPDPELDITRDGSYVIPDATGLGLADALYLLENRGFKVRTEGRGKVVSQDPPAGMPGTEGTEITLKMQ